MYKAPIWQRNHDYRMSPGCVCLFCRYTVALLQAQSYWQAVRTTEGHKLSVNSPHLFLFINIKVVMENTMSFLCDVNCRRRSWICCTIKCRGFYFTVDTYVQTKLYKRRRSQFRSQCPGISTPFKINIQRNICCKTTVFYWLCETVCSDGFDPSLNCIKRLGYLNDEVIAHSNTGNSTDNPKSKHATRVAVTWHYIWCMLYRVLPVQ